MKDYALYDTILEIYKRHIVKHIFIARTKFGRIKKK